MEKIQKGFTLIEVAIAAAVSTIILFGAFAILQVSNRQLEIAHAKMTLRESTREALFKMAQEIRQTSRNKLALEIWDTCTPPIDGVECSNTIDFVVPVPIPDVASLVDSHFIPNWSYGIQYSLDEEKHQILRTSTNQTTFVSKTTILANEITALKFSRPISNPGLITLGVEAQRTLSNGEMIPKNPIQMTTQAEARNP